MLNYLQSNVYALTVLLILPYLFVNLLCKITKNPILVPVDFNTRDSDTDWCDLHAFIYLHVSSQYRSEKDGENIGIIVENKLIYMD